MNTYDGERIGDYAFGNSGISSGRAFGAEGANGNPQYFGGRGRTCYLTTEPPGGPLGCNGRRRGGGDRA